MKIRKMWLGLLAALLALGLSVTGCDDDGDGNTTADSVAKSIKITDIPGGKTEAYVFIVSYPDPVAMGMGTISSNSVTVDLLKQDTTAWTGSGSYHLGLMFDSEITEYFYTNGQAPGDFLDGDETTEAQVFAKIQKYNISSALSTISFDKFLDVDDIYDFLNP